MHRKNQRGFTIIEIMFFVLIALLIAGAIFYVGKRMGEDDSKTETNSQPAQNADSKNDANKDWKTFEDTSANVSFKYPSDWKVAITKADETVPDDSKAEIYAGTVTSPSGKVSINYSNYIDGLGGGTCPDAFPCPTITILKIEDVPGSKGTLKYIEKITHRKDNGDEYSPVVGLLNSEQAAKLKVGEMVDNDIYMLADFGKHSGYFVLGMFAGQEAPSFKTYSEAQNYLDSANAATAEEIIKSFVIK